MPASTTTTFDWVDRLIGGQLDEKLKQWREEGLSYRAISEKLRDLSVTVHWTTVGRWMEKLERGEKP